LPAVYTGVHASVAAMLSGALATIGAYVLLRIGAGMLPRVLELSIPVIIMLGLASIVYGGILAVSRHDPSAVIAYSSIGQVGYILIAIAIGGHVGIAAAILFSIVNSANKTLLFLAGDQANRAAGLAYAIGGLSVAGIPLALGFWSKAALMQSSIVAPELWQRVILTIVIVIGGLLSILYMFQSFGRTYWQSAGVHALLAERPRTQLILLLAAAIVVLGFWPEPLIALSDLAATTLVPRGAP
jgi:multicomponent Na+:H+ antiporter subunit D